MATARQFSVLYNLVATICGDLSSNGLSQAQNSINTTIKKINSEFKMPEFFKGYDNSIFVTPTVGVGTQILSLASDVVRLENVWWIDNAQTNWPLDEITSDSEWLSVTDKFSTIEPEVYRYFQPSANNANAQIQIWPAANSAWIQQSGGKLYYSYWSQFAQLSADSDIPNIPYELDPILVDGGVVEMARQQGDYVLLSPNGGDYLNEYERDKGNMRAWLIKQHSKDGTVTPDMAQGSFGISSGSSGYKVGGSISPV